MSAQAVGGAVGHNEISVIIPCHRVVGTNGSLTGYAGGTDTKIALLKLEHTDMSRLSVPKKDSIADDNAEIRNLNTRLLKKSTCQHTRRD